MKTEHFQSFKTGFFNLATNYKSIRYKNRKTFNLSIFVTCCLSMTY